MLESESGQTSLISSAVLLWFVGRDHELGQFRKMLAGQEQNPVLLVTGPAGIGKTWLLRRLYLESLTQGHPATFLDFSTGETIDTLELLHRAALGFGSSNFPNLNQTLENATQIEVLLKVESSPGGGGVSIESGRDTYIQADIAGRDIIKNNTFHLQTNNLDLQRIWTHRLKASFFQDLEQLAREKTLVFFFDEFQIASSEVQSWFHAELLRRVGENHLKKIKVVLSGEKTIALASGWQSLVNERKLLPLQYKDVQTYLKDKRHLRISEEVGTTVFEITGGRPDLVSLIADNQAGIPVDADKNQLLTILVQGILENAEKSISETLRLAAVPEWFDAPLMASLLLTTEGIDARLAALDPYSLVQKDERHRYYFAPSVRQTLLSSWDDEQLRLQDLQRRAAEHFDGRKASTLDPGSREEFNRQAVGHWLVVDEREGLRRLTQSFNEALDAYRLARCESLLQRASSISSLSDYTQSWLQYFNGSLALADNKFSHSLDMFNVLLDRADLHPKLQALACWRAGQTYAQQGEWVKSQSLYEESLRYFQGEGNLVQAGQVMLALGEVHLQHACVLGGLIAPNLHQGRNRQFIRTIFYLPIALPFIIYAWAVRRWRFLPPLHHSFSYRNWTLVRLLQTSVSWYREAEAAFTEAREENLHVVAQLGLAETYTRLGRLSQANALFAQSLNHRAVVNNKYRHAQIQKAFAESEIDVGHTKHAKELLENCLRTFRHYKDIQAEAQAKALLGQVLLQEGDVSGGLLQYQDSLTTFSVLNDWPSAGQALHTLREWRQRSEPTPEQAEQIDTLIQNISLKPYFPRVPDKWVLLFTGILLGVLVLMGVGFIVFISQEFLPNLLSPMVFIKNILSPSKIVGLVLFFVLLFVGINILGLSFVLLGTSRDLTPQELDRIVARPEAVERYNYQEKLVAKIPWSDLNMIFSIERGFWRQPSLFSETRLYGHSSEIRVSGTMLWYDEFKKDVAHHLSIHHYQPSRVNFDLYILKGKPGLLLGSALFMLLVGIALIKNFPGSFMQNISPDIAASAGSWLTTIGTLALIGWLYWNFFLHGLWVNFQLKPRSYLPVMTLILGIILVAVGTGLAFCVPFLPYRNILDQIVFSAGYVLLIVSSLWIIIGRVWTKPLFERGTAAYSIGARVLSAMCLVGALVLTGLFIHREWVPYNQILRAMTYYQHQDYEAAVVNATDALNSNPDLADGYFYRSRAFISQGEYEQAVADLNTLIDSGMAIAADFVARAEAYDGLGNQAQACADLKAALDLLPSTDSDERERALSFWVDWRCTIDEE